MVEALPFPAYLYNREKVGSLQQVVGLPYDKIPPELKQTYRRRSPYHVVHLIRPESYVQAKELWDLWTQKGILRLYPQPAFYLYTQSYVWEGEVRKRHGVIALVELKEWQDGIYPHENTFSGPKRDRLQLLQTTEVHMGQIFMVYKTSESLLSLWQEITRLPPLMEAEMEELGETHSLWAIDEPEKVQHIQRVLQKSTLFVADGHHRYETALAFAKQKKEELGSQASRFYQFCMATLVDLADPGLTLLPTHRLVHTPTSPSPIQIREKLNHLFHYTTFSSLEAMQKWLAQTESPSLRIGVLTSEEIFGCTPRSEVDWQSFGVDPLLHQVPVAILHQVVLPLLGYQDQQRDEGERISFFRHPHEGWEKIQRGEAKVAFLVSPLSLESFAHVAQSGKRLPQKSTDFYPKMLSGMAFYAPKAMQQ